jgi:hypothetical protein
MENSGSCPSYIYREHNNSAAGGRQSSLAAHTALKNRKNDENTLTKSSKGPLRPAGASPPENLDEDSPHPLPGNRTPHNLFYKSGSGEVFFSVNPSAPIPKSEPPNYTQLQL